MTQKLKLIVKYNILVILYLFMFLFLFIGVFVHSGDKYLFNLLIYLFAFLTSIIIFNKLQFFQNIISRIKAKINDKIVITNIQQKKISNFFFYFSISFIIFHLIYLKSIPIFDAFNSNNSDTISIIRNNITENKLLIINYMHSFVIKAILPFFLLFFYIVKEKSKFLIFLVISIFYIFSIISKSPILNLFFPLLIFVFFKKKFKQFFIFLLITILLLIINIFITNPRLRGIQDKAQNFDKQRIEETMSMNKTQKTIYALYKRTIIAPGEVVSLWFENIPKNLPYLNGCGYRFLKPFMKNCQYKNYSLEMYKLIYKENVDKNINGSLNTASFMYDYANWSNMGLIISAIILTLLFYIISIIFHSNHILAISINGYSILHLSSTCLTTLLFSGGWFLLIILYILFRYKLNEK